MLKFDLLATLRTKTIAIWGSSAAVAGFAALEKTDSSNEALKVIAWVVFSVCVGVVTAAVFALLLRGLHRWLGPNTRAAGLAVAPTGTATHPLRASPAKAMKCCSFSLVRPKGTPEELEILILVFNGNSSTVEFAMCADHQVRYGKDRIIDTLLEYATSISPYGELFITIACSLDNEVGDVILADLAKGELKEIDLTAVKIPVSIGDSKGFLPLPQGILAKRHAEYWTCGQALTINFSERIGASDKR